MTDGGYKCVLFDARVKGIDENDWKIEKNLRAIVTVLKYSVHHQLLWIVILLRVNMWV